MRAFLLCGLLILSPAALAAGEAGDQPVLNPEIGLSPAEARADRLDRLFARLKLAAGYHEAVAAEMEIWKVWGEFDSPTAETLLEQAQKAMNAQEMVVAEEQLTALIGAYPDFAEALNKRATLHFLAHRYDRSLADINRVLALEPRHFGALSGRGMIYQIQGKLTDALASFREALSIYPNMPGPLQAVKELERLEKDI